MTTLVTTDVRRIADTAFPAFPPADYMVTAGDGGGRIATVANLKLTYEQIYELNPNCAAVVNKLARQLSTLPVKVYDRPPGEEAPEEVRGHPLQKLLDKPAPRRGPAYWKQALARSALVQGNGLLAKYRGPSMTGPTEALLAVSWPYVAAYAPLGCPVEWWSTVQTGQTRFFRVDESIHLAWETGDLHGLGVSPLKPLAEAVKLDDAARRYQAAYYGNSARPASLVVPPPGYTYTGTQREDLKAEIERIHGGVDQAFKMALLAPGFDVKTLTHTSAEAEVIAARQLSRDEFAMVYDVPPPMIGDLTHATYSNVEELHRILYITTLRPWFALIEEVLQRQLIDEEDYGSEDVYVCFDLAEVLRGNRREEIDAAAQAFVNGLMTLNEVRAFLGLAPVDPANDPEDLANTPHIPANNLKALSQTGEDRGEPTAAPGENPDAVRGAPEKVIPPAPARAMPDDITNK